MKTSLSQALQVLKKSIARKTRSIVLVVIGSIVLTGCATSIEDYNAAVIQGIVDQNNNILATGYAVISAQKSDIPAQQRILSIRASKLDAYRALMEQIYGQYLDANTTIGEMVMKSDTLKARVQGMVYGARLVSINPVGDDTYETTLSLDKNIVNDLRRLFLAARANQSLASS
ncbi:LPP20 family lipoprotein [Porticoccaceae bacterium]|jgi:hypothetical protein|nr:hypothetical protein [Porticoccaceae bacterium]MCT2533006.1 LPP20 family lipoprotein [SAR92 clade bacterium H231]MDA8978686.1 LPP20 family lipoprotein [bacterium]MBT6319176.1 hypothetical protein [Porticoccaceae bacterium]MBT7258812.1 hypothetical protein [Porticoccaceae bacterium]